MARATTLCIIVVFWALCSPAYAESFPYIFTPEKGDVTGSRAEGRADSISFLEKLSYLNKYLRQPKTTAPPEALAHFALQNQEQKKMRSTALANVPQKRLKLGLVGDIMWIQNGWRDFLSPEARLALLSLDVLIGNLETPITSSFPVPEGLPDVFKYNSDPYLIKSFARPDGSNLFSALSIANNHALDRGDQGAIDTQTFLREQKIPFSGSRAKKEDKNYVVFEKGGIKFGFYAATWGVNWAEDLAASKIFINFLPGIAPEPEGMHHKSNLSDVKTALEGMKKDGAEFKVISFHWGHEFEFYPTPIEMQIARETIALGADLILGGHSHVPQPIEICTVNSGEAQGVGHCSVQDTSGSKRKALVIYSLGNFVSAMFTPPCKVGTLQELSVFRTSSGGIDWQLGDKKLFYNYEGGRDTHGQRKLFTLDSYLMSCQKNKSCSQELKHYLDFLRTHLGL